MPLRYAVALPRVSLYCGVAVVCATPYAIVPSTALPIFPFATTPCRRRSMYTIMLRCCLRQRHHMPRDIWSNQWCSQCGRWPHYARHHRNARIRHRVNGISNYPVITVGRRAAAAVVRGSCKRLSTAVYPLHRVTESTTIRHAVGPWCVRA